MVTGLPGQIPSGCDPWLTAWDTSRSLVSRQHKFPGQAAGGGARGAGQCPAAGPSAGTQGPPGAREAPCATVSPTAARGYRRSKAPTNGPRCTRPPSHATDAAKPARQLAIAPAHRMTATCQRLRDSTIAWRACSATATSAERSSAASEGKIPPVHPWSPACRPARRPTPAPTERVVPVPVRTLARTRRRPGTPAPPTPAGSHHRPSRSPRPTRVPRHAADGIRVRSR